MSYIQTNLLADGKLSSVTLTVTCPKPKGWPPQLNLCHLSPEEQLSRAYSLYYFPPPLPIYLLPNHYCPLLLFCPPPNLTNYVPGLFTVGVGAGDKSDQGKIIFSQSDEAGHWSTKNSPPGLLGNGLQYFGHKYQVSHHGPNSWEICHMLRN